MLKNKVLLIGLDGASPELLEKWIREGILPNFARLVKTGVFCGLRSTLPPLSAPAWTSAFTGVNPGKHNIFNFTYDSGYDKKITTSIRRKCAPIWELLGDRDKTVGVINVIATYPPERVKGFMISGFGTPSIHSAFTYPTSLRSELVRREYKIDLDFVQWMLMTTTDEEKLRVSFVESVWEMTKKRKEISLELMERFGPDIFIVIFVALDRIQHYFWSRMESGRLESTEESRRTIQTAYEKIDNVIGEILASIDKESNIVVFSDHGFGSVSKYVHLNQWFVDASLLKLKRFSRLQPFRILGATRRNLFKIARRTLGGATIEWLVLKRWTSIQRRIPPADLRVETDCNWKRTKAYFTSPYWIRINVVGREPQGVVSPGKEYEDLRDYIKAELLKLKDPENGERLVKSVHRREDIYSGPCVRNAPDLIIEMQEGCRGVDSFANGKLVLKPSEMTRSSYARISADHRPYGILLLRGPAFKEGFRIEDCKIVDVAPTALYLMGLSVPRYMDGRVIENAIKPDFLTHNPILYE